MMKTADSRLCPDRAVQIRSHFGGSSAGRLFIQSEMRSVVVVIENIFEADAHQMSLVERDHVIQHLTAYAGHPSFRNAVLPRTANTYPDRLDPPLAFRNVRTSVLNFRSRSKMTYRYGHGSGSASRSCWTIHSLVGCAVMLKWRMRR